MKTAFAVFGSLLVLFIVSGCGSSLGGSSDFGNVMAEAVYFVKQIGTEGTGPGQLTQPVGLALDDVSNVYVCEYGDRRRVSKFRRDGKFLLKWGGKGTLDGEFQRPRAIEVGPDGIVSVSDNGPDRHTIKQFTGGGTFLRRVGGRGTGDGQLHYNGGVAADPNTGQLYVADFSRVQKFTPSGGFLLKWGSFGTGAGQFHDAYGITVGPDGKVCVIDALLSSTEDDRIAKFTDQGVFIRRWGVGKDVLPHDLCVDGHDNVWVTISYYEPKVQRWKKYGELKEGFGGSGSGPGQFIYPTGIQVSPDDKIYVGDKNNGRIQKFRRGGT